MQTIGNYLKSGREARNIGNAEQFKRMMNITFIEGVTQGVSKIKEQYKDSQYYYKFDTIIFKHDLVLTKLTGNLKPKELLREMYNLSERS